MAETLDTSAGGDPQGPTCERRVLFIAFYFPPDGGGGTQRTLKFCKYLPAMGWRPIVLAPPPRDHRGQWTPRDASLLDEVGPEVVVERVPIDPDPPSGWAAELPRLDEAHRWLEPAAEAAERLVAEHRCDAVVLSLAPYDLGYVGRRLAERLDVPIVLDLRDPWALDGARVHASRRAWRRQRDAMGTLCRSVDAVIANTPDARSAITTAFPDLADRTTLRTITNGYDPADFADRPTERPPAPEGEGQGVAHADRPLTLLHAGTFHARQGESQRGWRGRVRSLIRHQAEPADLSGRTPRHLLAAIDRLRQSAHPLGRRVRLVQVGVVDDALRRLVADSPAGDAVELVGYLDHAEATRRIADADALFLPLHGLPAGHRSRIVPGKFYEYLAARRPILGALPAGDARDWLLDAGLGEVADPTDPAALADALVRLDEGLAAGRYVGKPDADVLARFDRRRLTRDLADLLDALTGGGAVGSSPARSTTTEAVPA
jgi:glycosyltransferase involved in cell wall biosynthesis